MLPSLMEMPGASVTRPRQILCCRSHWPRQATRRLRADSTAVLVQIMTSGGHLSQCTVSRRVAQPGRAPVLATIILLVQGRTRRRHQTVRQWPRPVRRRESIGYIGAAPFIEACPSSRSEASLRRDWLEQFNEIAGGILDERLPAADAFDDAAPKMHARAAQTLDRLGHVLDLDREAVPASWFRRGPIRQDRSSPCIRSNRGAQHQAEVTAREHRKDRRGMHVKVKSQMRGVERDGCVDI